MMMMMGYIKVANKILHALFLAQIIEAFYHGGVTNSIIRNGASRFRTIRICSTTTTTSSSKSEEELTSMKNECYDRKKDDRETFPILTCMGGKEDDLFIKLSSNTFSTRRKKYDRKRQVSINYYPWTGFRGMLPLQKFRNPMEDKMLFENWLIDSLPKNEVMTKMPRLQNENRIDKKDGLKNITAIENRSPELEFNSKKKEAEYKASLELDPNVHLCPVYIDSHIVVVNKKSGVLSVPGPRRNPNVADLVHTYIGNDENDVDCMVVHRLDMDTSGVLVYARSKRMLSILHDSFRAKSMNYDQSNSSFDSSTFVSKTYEALVCGHMAISEGEIDLPLMRDRLHPPFMKVWTGEGENERDIDKESATLNLQGKEYDTGKEKIKMDEATAVKKHRGYVKMMKKAPKPCLTHFRVLGREYIKDPISSQALPVTRVELVPITGRTHQLRVHCAAIGHPIVGDNIYGKFGDGSENGGYPLEEMNKLYPRIASQSLQKEIYKLVQQSRYMFWNKDQEHDDKNYYTGDLCLHAKRLNLQHPLTKAPMSFEVDPPF